MRSLVDKVAVVAGASGGIGAAVALALSREGCDLVLIARNRDGLEETACEVKKQTGRKALICPTDLSSLEDIQCAFTKIRQHFGRVDILYNGVAGHLEDDIYSADPEDITYFIQSTLVGAIWLTKGILPLMYGHDAHVINIITDWAMPNTSGPSTFVAGKYGLLGFGQALSKEVLPQRVRVTNILPGDVASDLPLSAGLQDVIEQHGLSKVPVSDIVEVILLSLKLDLAKIDHLVVTPVDPEY